eukprot:g29032.t1
MQCVFASRFAVLQAVARPKPDRASSPNGSNSAVFPAQIQVGGSLRPVDKIDSDRHGYVSPQKGHAGFSHSGGYFSPNGSPPMSPQAHHQLHTVFDGEDRYLTS